MSTYSSRVIRTKIESGENPEILNEFRDKCNRHSQWGSGVDSPGLYTIACCPEKQRGSCTALKARLRSAVLADESK